MFSHIDDAWVAGTVVSLRAQHAGALLIVEGDTDQSFFEALVDTGLCLIVVAHGRDNAIGAMRRLTDRSFEGALAIVDADFDVLEDRSPPLRDIFFTDGHDVEMMTFASPALEKVLGEFGQRRRVQQFPNLRGTLLESARSLGYLLWLSVRDCLGLRFEGLSYRQFVDERTLAVEETLLLKTVIDHSQAHHLGERLPAQLAAIKADAHDPLHLCCGHHVVCILAVAFCKALGTHSRNEITPGLIERALRLSYEESYFGGTQLCKHLRNWEQQNSRFPIFKRSRPVG
ncbi:MAG TPA: DUF4435 domain-containing protein [Polyangia bacterium]|jgi:hypothetical protein|nr:DUF4435 domain-containing protein [Polyangia bacterium]